MSIEILAGSIILICIGFIGWLSYKLGKISEQRETSKTESNERAKDAEIAAKPYSPTPISDIRRMCGED